MDKNQSVRLLDETFNNDFDVNRFVKFIKELFNNFEINPKSWTVWEAFQDYIESFQLLGSYENSKKVIDVLAVKLRRTGSLDRARTMQRNFIAKWLSNAEKEAALVAFYGDDPQDWRFSFVKMEYQLVKEIDGKVKIAKELTPAKRYSFLVGVNEPNHTCKSQFVNLLMQESVNPSLEEIEAAFSIDKVTKLFFIEYKELYLKLKEAVEKFIRKDKNIREEFEEKAISTVDFTKKLMGQIVFIYFLQKKGWLGVEKDKGKFKEWGTGPKNFLRKLFEKKNYENFFNDVLEPLFYEALATERDDDYYRLFECKIPFLNGGLFEPMNEYNWRETDLLLSNDIFERILNTFDQYNFTVKEDEPLEKEVAIDPEMLGKVFENLIEENIRKGQGAYYTPREIVHYMCQQSLINYLETNSGIAKEDVETFIQLGDFAIDILIKERENLKKYGRSYVKDEEHKLPKTIRENYAKIDGLLKNIKIVDPAVGSGAFPVGMMNEIVKARSILSIFFSEEEQKKRTNYNLKREIIENCLYGVDIDSSAVDIAKLRFWLSLIVDEMDMKNIQPLPNLDHKIMCGNSLLEEFEGHKLFDDKLLGEVKKDYSFEIKQIDAEIAKLNQEKGEIARGKLKNGKGIKDIEREINILIKKKQKILSAPKSDERNATFEEIVDKKIKESQRKLKELKELQHKFFNEQSRKLKKQYRDEIEKIEWEFIEATLEEQGNKEAMKKLEQYKKNKSKPFFLWKLYFSEIFTRENPGFDVVIANPPYVGEKGHKDIFREIKNGFLGNFYHGQMDLFYFFFHLALELGRENAQISFISTNYYLTARGARILRKTFKTYATLRELVNFNELKIFESAKGQHNIITLIEKTTSNNSVRTSITTRTGVATADVLSSILAQADAQTTYYTLTQTDLYDGEENYIRLAGRSLNSDLPLNRVLSKISKDSLSLIDCCNVNVGLYTGADKVTDNHLDEYNIKADKSEGIFVLTKQEVDSLRLNKIEQTLIKPFFKNSDIKSFYTNCITSKYLICLSYPDKKNIDLTKIPSIFAHLNKFEKILKGRKSNDNGLQSVIKKGYWYMFTIRQIDFAQPKIVCPQRSQRNTFGYNEVPWYASADVYFITEKDTSVFLKYVLALLNSALYYLWLYHRGKRKGESLELYQKPLSEIPIKKISPEQQKPFIQLVDQILSITKDEDYLNNPTKQSKVKKFEKEIDQLVYKLYELTPEEIKIVEDFYDKK